MSTKIYLIDGEPYEVSPKDESRFFADMKAKGKTPTLEGEEEGNQNDAATTDANATSITTASSQGTDPSNNQQENTESTSEESFSDLNLDNQTQEQVDTNLAWAEKNSHIMGFADLNKKREEEKLEPLNIDDYQWDPQNNTWTIPGEGESIPVDIEDPTHGEAVSILEKKRKSDREFAEKSIAEVPLEWANMDESESIDKLFKEYGLYGFNFVDDSKLQDSIVITHPDYPDSPPFNVDQGLFGDDEEANAAVAKAMTEWMRERVDYEAESQEQRMMDNVKPTNDQKSINNGNTSKVYADSDKLNKKVDAITSEDEAEETSIREELRDQARMLAQQSAIEEENVTVDDHLNILVAERYKEMGKEVPSTLNAELDKVNKGQVGINNETARVELAREKYLDGLEYNKDTGEWEQVRRKLEGKERVEVGKSLTKEMMLTQYDNIDKYDSELLDRSKELTLQQKNRDSVEKNLRQQVRDWDGAWTSIGIEDEFWLNEKQDEMEIATDIASRKLKREEKEAIASLKIIDNSYVPLLNEQQALNKQIDQEGTETKIKEIQDRVKSYSTKNIDNIDKELETIKSGEYTTQAQVDKANERINALLAQRESYVSDYNTTVETDQAEMQEIVNAYQSRVDVYNENAATLKTLDKARTAAYLRVGDIQMDQTQMSSYNQMLGKDYDKWAIAGAGLTNAAVDLLQGLDQAAYMISPMGEIADWAIEEGHIKDPALKTLVQVAKAMNPFTVGSIDLDGDSETPTMRERRNKAIDDWQTSYMSKFAPPMSFHDISSAEDAGEYALQMMASQIPNLALMATTGPYGLALMGAGAAGQKFNDMDRERNLYRETGGIQGMNHDFWTMMGVSTFSGAVEAASEYVTFGQMKYVKGVMGIGKAVSREVISEIAEGGIRGAGKYLTKNVLTKEALFYTAKDFIQEGVSESAAQIGGNLLDIYSGKDVSIWDGVPESFVSGTLISSMVKSPLIYHHAAAAFQPISTTQAINSNNTRLAQIRKELSDPKITPERSKELQQEIGQIFSANKSLIEQDANRVDMLGPDKSKLIKIHGENQNIKREYLKVKNDKSLSEEDKQKKLDELSQRYDNNLKTKEDVLSKYEVKNADLEYKKGLAAIEAINKSIEAGGGSLNIEVNEVTDKEMEDLAIREEHGEGFDSYEDIVNLAESQNNLIQELTNIVNDPNSTPAEVEAAKERIAEAETELSRTNQALNMIPNVRRYGSMVPKFKIDKNGNRVLDGLSININTNTAIKNGRLHTAAHELTHAVLHNTLKYDPDARARVGGAVMELLESGEMSFKDDAAAADFYRRTSGYKTEDGVQAEEIIAIASEMYNEGNIIMNDSLLQKFKNVIRNFTQQYIGYDINLDTTNDVKNFLKSIHRTVQTGKVNKSLGKMIQDGANGRLVSGVKIPTKGEIQFSKAVDANVKANPDLMQTFDKFTRNEDGSSKYDSAEEFKLSPDFLDAYSEIVDGRALDGLIQQGMTELGLPPEALKEFTREVKEELGRRLIQNYNYDTNKSLFGWLTGVSGGAGRSIIYRAKGDVMNRYKKSQQADTVSIDKPVGEGSSLGDVIEGQRDDALEALDDMDLTPGRKEAAQEVVNELKAREVLDFNNVTNEAIDRAIKAAGIKLDDLAYKDVKAFLNTAQKVTKKDKNGNLILDKKTGKPKLYKATKTGDVKPTGPLFKVLDAVSKEFGVDPLRILADQDLNSKQRKEAQKLIYRKTVNEDGSFNPQLFDLLPEGDTRSGVATGVANTKLGEFYDKGGRAAMAEGATGAGKAVQNKRTDVSMEEFLGMFGIQPDGAMDTSTKNDGAIRALVVQMAQLEANQQMRLQAMEGGSTSDAVLAKLGEGKGEMVYSQAAANVDQVNTFHRQVAAGNLSRTSVEAAVKRVFGEGVLAKNGNLNSTGRKIANETLKQIEGFKEVDKALQGKYSEISGKDILAHLKEHQTINSHIQGVKNILKPILPKNENGKPIDPGTLANDKDGINTQREHITLSTEALVEEVGVVEAARLMIAHSLKSFAGSGKMGDGRHISLEDGGDVVETPGWENSKDKDGNTVYGLKWKRYSEKDKKNGLIPKGSRVGDVKFKNGKPIPQDNRLQTTTGKDDYAALVSKGLPEGYSIDSSDSRRSYVLVSPDGTRVDLDTSLSKESTKALFADIARELKADPINGLFNVFNKKKKESLEARKVAKTILDSAWKRVKDPTDNFNEGDFALLVISLGSSMDAPLRKAAYPDRIPSNYKALVAKYGANAVGQLFQYEHGNPKVAVASKIVQSYINNNEMTDDVWDGYTVQVIHKKLDGLIDASGNKYTARVDGAPRAFNADTLALVKTLTKQELSEIAPLISMDPDNPGVMGEAWVAAAQDIHNSILPSHLTLERLGKGRRTGLWSKDTKPKGMSTFDFDETLIIEGENFVIATDPVTGDQVKISSDQWPVKGPELAQQGYEFDFSDFANVRGGTDGPLLEKMRNQVKKYGPDHVYVLTARQQDSAGPIHEWLKSKGINIPLENITGLGKSEGSAKGEWMLQKFNEGYNDMYFVDDAMSNVKAVKDVLDQLDIKSKVVQAKVMFSQEGAGKFNDILQRVTGVPKDKIFSDAQARLRGKKAGGFKFFVPPSAEDFKGLLYNFLGKGKQGDADMAFFKEHLLDPFAKGVRNINGAKQKIADEFKKLRKSSPDVVKRLNDKVPNSDYSIGDAMRVYLWNKNGIEIPGLLPQEIAYLSDFVFNDPKLAAFAEKLSAVSRAEEGYVKPDENWVVGNIASDLHHQTSKVNRADFLAEWIENKNIIFSPENLNKIEAVYGTDFRDALENMLERMETGSNRLTGSKDKVINGFMDWINGSVGAVMFFNTRSAVLQTLSTVNFINWGDNNMFAAAKAFANQPQYWKDFLTLFNSDMLKQRRAGMAIDVNLAELSDVVSKASGKDKAKAALRYLLQLGFTPTQIADSFAIAAGGSTFYRNRINKYLKEGLSQKEAEAKAFEDFQEIAEETQQSSRPDLISQQQAGALGRLVLAWQNTPMQYTRLTKKAISDLVNGRGDWKQHVSRILYYGAMQNVIFGSLQTGLAFLLFGGDEDEEKTRTKTTRVANGALDTLLRGTGVYGAMASTLKNTIMKYMDERDKPYGKRELSKVALEAMQLSPPIGSKLRKIMSAIYGYEYNKGVPEQMGVNIDNPILNVVGNVIEATTNFPLARAVRKAQNIEEAINGNHELWKRIALIGGWDKWSLDIKDADVQEARDVVKQEKKDKKKAEKEAEKEETKKKEEQEKKDKGIKQVRCSGIKSNGSRCSIMVETKAKSAKCMYHKSYKEGEASDRDNDGIKEYRCTGITGSGKRCKNRTENKNKKCYAHQ